MTAKNEFKSLIENLDNFHAFIDSIVGEDFEGAVGVRGLYENEGLGNLRNSVVWDDGEMTDESLDGTCAIGVSDNWDDCDIEVEIKHLLEVLRYGNGKIGLVVGEAYPERGNDWWSNEVIIKNAKVVFVW